MRQQQDAGEFSPGRRVDQPSNDEKRNEDAENSDEESVAPSRTCLASSTHEVLLEEYVNLGGDYWAADSVLRQSFSPAVAVPNERKQAALPVT